MDTFFFGRTRIQFLKPVWAKDPDLGYPKDRIRPNPDSALQHWLKQMV